MKFNKLFAVMAAASACAVLTVEPTFARSVAAASICGVVVITKDMAPLCFARSCCCDATREQVARHAHNGAFPGTRDSQI